MVEFVVDYDRLQVGLYFENDDKRLFVGYIYKDGFHPVSGPILTPETLKTIATKAKEVKEWGVNPELCPHCKGTPYFPNNNCISERHLEFY